MNSIDTAKQKLQETDWSVLPDVETRLANKQEFVYYRQALRNIIINNLVVCSIPTEPTAVWSTPPQAE
jgi:hypothetical protein